MRVVIARAHLQPPSGLWQHSGQWEMCGFLGSYSRCAQECAHASAAICGHRVAELLADSRLKAKATVFWKSPAKSASVAKNSQDPQVLAPAYTCRRAVRWPRGWRRRFA